MPSIMDPSIQDQIAAGVPEHDQIHAVGAGGQQYTRKALYTAFIMVEPRPNWKERIDTCIRSEERDVTREAIIYFTGSVPTFVPVAPGWHRVQAAGYYAAVGA